MKIILAIVVFLSTQIICGLAKAETCDGIYPPTNEWVRRMTSESKFIFVGSIASIEDLGPGVQRVRFNITERVKGEFSGTAFSGGWGPGFELKLGEERVFFVNKDNYLQSCSEYKYYFTDRGMKAEIRSAMDGT